MAKTPTVPNDVKDAHVMRAWYQSLRNSLEGLVLSVKDFGAAGNGAKDDTLAFKKAIAFASDNHGSLYIPKGNYKITSVLTIAETIIIFGDGPKTSIIEPHLTSTGGNLFSFTAGGNLVIRDLGFDGTDVTNPTPTTMVYMINVDPTTGTLENINIDNVRFSNLNLTKGTYGTDADADLRVTHCIFLDNVDNVAITNCHLDDVSGSFVYAQYVNHIKVEDNYIKDVSWYPIHFEARVRFFNIAGNYFNQADAAGSLLGGFIDVLEDTTIAIPTSGTDPNNIFYNNGIIQHNYMEGVSAYTSVINVLSTSGVVIKDNILNGIVLGTNNSTDTFLYGIHVGTRAASTTLFYGPPIGILIEGNFIRSTDNGGDNDYAIRVDNDFQSSSSATSRRNVEHVIVKNNTIGFHLYNKGSVYSDINIDKGIYFDGGNGGIQDIICEGNSILASVINQTSADGAGVIDFTGNSTGPIDGVRVGGNRIEMAGTANSSSNVGIYIDQYVENVVNTSPNHFKGFYTAVETVGSGNGSLYNLDIQTVEGATDAYIFGTALTDTQHTTLSGNTASRPASGKNLTDYMTYFDTTESQPIWYDSSAWIDALGGAPGTTYVNTTGTPADNQVPIFTDADTVEGDANFTYDGVNLDLGASDKISFNTVDILSDSSGTMTLSNIDAVDATTQETIEDVAGAMVTGNTETGITVTYQDSSGDIDFVVSDTTVAGDSGSTGITPGDTLTIAGGTNVTTAMSGDTLTINAGSGVVDTTGTPADSQIAVFTDSNTLEGTSDFTFDGADFILYNAVNDGNTEIRLGAADAEELHLQTVFDSGAQTLDYVLFQTDAASATANKGLYRFNVDGTDILDIDDGGIDLDSGKALSIAGTDVLTNNTLGSGVTSSSLTSLGTISTGTWQGTTVAVNQGGTGQTSYTNGQLLIGNTSGNTLTKATLSEGEGIDIANSTGSITISGEDATVSNKGIASFATANFAVSSGAVTIKSGGVDLTDEVTGTLPVGSGGTGATTLTEGGVLLGSGTGAVTAMSVLSDSEMIVGDGTTDPVAESGATLRTSIGVGTGNSPQFTGIELGHATDTTVTRASAGDLNIEGNIVYRAGGTDVPVADGGTGASTLTSGGVLLGSGTGAITAMSVLADSEMIVGDGTTDPVAESGATLRTSIGVAIGSNVQAYDADLTKLATAYTSEAATTAATFKFLEGTNNGTNGVTLAGPASTADVTVVLPAAADTLVGKATTDTFTNKTFDANGTGNALSNVDVADLANGTDGELITWDASAGPTTVAVGTADHVLTSNGAGAAPTFQAAGSSSVQEPIQRSWFGI